MDKKDRIEFSRRLLGSIEKNIESVREAQLKEAESGKTRLILDGKSAYTENYIN